MFTQVSSQLDGYLFIAALQSRLFPFMRRSFSAKASLYSISRASFQALRAPLLLQPCVGSLSVPILRTLENKRWQVSVKDHNHSCFQFLQVPSCKTFWNTNSCQPGPPTSHRFKTTANSNALSIDSRVFHSSFSYFQDSLCMLTQILHTYAVLNQFFPLPSKVSNDNRP